MDRETFIKRMAERKPIVCAECHGRMRYIGAGLFECFDCGYQEMDDFGKVKRYIDENGPAPAIVISDCTGVPVDLINGMLKEGRLEIPEGSKIYIKCEKCGCSIRYGRFCPECLKQRTNNLAGIYFSPEYGERPKTRTQENGAAMRFLGMEKEKNYRKKK